MNREALELCSRSRKWLWEKVKPRLTFWSWCRSRRRSQRGTPRTRERLARRLHCGVLDERQGSGDAHDLHPEEEHKRNPGILISKANEALNNTRMGASGHREQAVIRSPVAASSGTTERERCGVSRRDSNRSVIIASHFLAGNVRQPDVRCLAYRSIRISAACETTICMELSSSTITRGVFLGPKR